MDLEVEIKEEPIWLEGTPSTSLDSCMSQSTDKDSVVKDEPQTSVTPVIENGSLDSRAEDAMTAAEHYKTFKETFKKMYADEEMVPKLNCHSVPLSNPCNSDDQYQVFEESIADRSEPSAGGKDEIFIDKRTVDQLVPCFKEESNVESIPVSPEDPVQSCDGRCETLSRTSQQEPTHSAQKLYCCAICSSEFSRRKSLISHLMTHSTRKRFPCSHCSRSYSHKTSLTSHLMRYTGEMRYRCKLCTKMFPQRYSLRNHLLTHARKIIHCCPLCECTFGRKGVLKDHLLSHCRKRPYYCTLCKITFSLQFRLQLHLLTHVISKPMSELNSFWGQVLQNVICETTSKTS